MRVLVLGGTRFIGAAAVRRLVTAGHEVTLFHRGPDHPQGLPEVACLHGDRAELGAWRERLRAVGAEVVLDMRPVWEADAEAVMDAFRGQAERVVAISSCDVYRAYGLLLGLEDGPLEPTPLTEEAPLRTKLRPYRAQASGPDDHRYHYDKIPAEAVFLGDDELAGTVLRLPMVYGPADYQHRLFPILKRIDDGRPAILLGERQAAWRSPRAHVEDIGEAIALAIGDARAAGRVYNVAEQPGVSERAWVERIAAATGYTGQIVVVRDDRLPPHLAEEARLEQHLDVSSNRIRAELGFREIVAADEAMRATIDWERAQPPDPVDPETFDYAAEDHLLARLA